MNFLKQIQKRYRLSSEEMREENKKLRKLSYFSPEWDEAMKRLERLYGKTQAHFIRVLHLMMVCSCGCYTFDNLKCSNCGKERSLKWNGKNLIKE